MTPTQKSRADYFVGYMIFESWTENDSGKPDPNEEWDGVITGPSDPTGANLAWLNPIKMIEYSALTAAEERARKLVAACKLVIKLWEADAPEDMIDEADVRACREAIKDWEDGK